MLRSSPSRADALRGRINSEARHRARIATSILVAVVGFAASLPIAAQDQEVKPAAERAAASPQQTIASSNADPAWRPSPEQRASIETVTLAYFAARDANKPNEAYAFLSPRQKQYLPSGAFQKLVEEFNAKAGAVQARRLRRITWYKDTPQAGPGLYVAVDYSSDFANLALHCGYLVWHEQPDGSFLQVREEANTIDRETMMKLKPADVDKVRAQFRC